MSDAKLISTLVPCLLPPFLAALLFNPTLFLTRGSSSHHLFRLRLETLGKRARYISPGLANLAETHFLTPPSSFHQAPPLRLPQLSCRHHLRVNVMYLSQPRDLISSMTAGCSRSTKLWPPADHLTMMPYTRADQALNRATRTDSAVYSSPRSHQEYSHVSQGSSTTSLLYHYGQVDQVNMSIEYANSSSNLVPAMPQFNGHAKSRWFRSQHYQQEWDNLDPGDAETRPSHAYTELIKLCILKRREGKLTLNQLYRDLEEKFPFFAASSKGKGWKVNSICSIDPVTVLKIYLTDQTLFPCNDRTHSDIICQRSPTSSSWIVSTASLAKGTTGRTVLISRNPLHWHRVPLSSFQIYGLRLSAQHLFHLERSRPAITAARPNFSLPHRRCSRQTIQHERPCPNSRSTIWPRIYASCLTSIVNREQHFFRPMQHSCSDQ